MAARMRNRAEVSQTAPGFSARPRRPGVFLWRGSNERQHPPIPTQPRGASLTEEPLDGRRLFPDQR